MMIHFKKPQRYFYIKTRKSQHQHRSVQLLFIFSPRRSCLHLLHCASAEGTKLQHVNINEVHDYQVWKYKTVIYDYLCLISATQDGENANQRQQHLGAIKKRYGLH